MSNTIDTTSRTFPIFTIIGTVFIILKLAGVTAIASWSWWWVLAPFWIPLVIAVGVAAVAALVFLIVSLFGRKRR